MQFLSRKANICSFVFLFFSCLPVSAELEHKIAESPYVEEFCGTAPQDTFMSQDGGATQTSWRETAYDPDIIEVFITRKNSECGLTFVAEKNRSIYRTAPTIMSKSTGLGTNIKFDNGFTSYVKFEAPKQPISDAIKRKFKKCVSEVPVPKGCSQSVRVWTDENVFSFFHKPPEAEEPIATLVIENRAYSY